MTSVNIKKQQKIIMCVIGFVKLLSVVSLVLVGAAAAAAAAGIVAAAAAAAAGILPRHRRRHRRHHFQPRHRRCVARYAMLWYG